MTTLSTTGEALAYLRATPDAKRTKVADIYENDDTFGAALRILFPNFEYPNFSYKTVSDVLHELRHISG